MENIQIDFYVMSSGGSYIATYTDMESAVTACDNAGIGSYVECDGLDEVLYTA